MVRRGVSTRFRPLMECSHSADVTGHVQIKQRRQLVVGRRGLLLAILKAVAAVDGKSSASWSANRSIHASTSALKVFISQPTGKSAT